MSGNGRPKILCVDDEPQVLEGLSDTLRRSFEVVTATSGADGLERLEADGPFVAVVSDMRMPAMNGATFLSFVQLRAPDTVRILLTGQADVDTAIAAVNQGQIFRFLTKPCPRETLLQALVAALRQHRLVTAERAILEETLNGAIKALTDLLAVTQPEAFGRANRLRRAARELAARTATADVWQVEMAAMLSQVGCLMLPDETAERYYYGQPLTDAEAVLVDRLPQAAARLIREIPRVEAVSEILADQNAPAVKADGTAPPVGARILRIAHDFDVLESAGNTTDLALAYMRGRTGRYDTLLLEEFARLRGSTDDTMIVRDLALAAVEPGMIFAEDVRPPAGGTLIARGQEVTATLLERLEALPDATRRQSVRVIAFDATA